ncbi:hypothetical protein COOONC_05763 [Cooperia oncophora]
MNCEAGSTATVSAQAVYHHVVERLAVRARRQKPIPLTVVQRNKSYYVPFLLDLRTKIAVAILFIVYVVISVYGITVMEQGLDYDKLLLQTDPLVEAFAREIELFPSGDQIEIAIKNAPDMSIPEKRSEDRADCPKFVADLPTSEVME